MKISTASSLNISESQLKGGWFLRYSGVAWFTITIAGQWMFAFYILAFYGGATIDGNLEAWNEVLPNGFIRGDSVNNLSVGIHVLMAFILSFFGPMQFIPLIRNRFPGFHRRNGRVYLMAAFVASLSGLIMVLLHGSASGIVGDISISINAMLIMGFAIPTVQYARNRQIDRHRRWALRLFLVVSGVWFFRIGLMFWLAVNQGPVGFDMETFRGPFLVFLGFGQYLIPLAVLEIFLIARKSKSRSLKAGTALGLCLLTLVIAIGTVVATMGMWLPRI